MQYDDRNIITDNIFTNMVLLSNADLIINEVNFCYLKKVPCNTTYVEQRSLDK